MAYISKNKDDNLMTAIPKIKIIVFDMQQCLSTSDYITFVVFYEKTLFLDKRHFVICGMQLLVIVGQM